MKDENADYVVQAAIKKGIGLEKIDEALEKAIQEMRVYIEKVIPYSEGGEVNRIRKYGQLISEEYSEAGILVKAYVPKFMA